MERIIRRNDILELESSNRLLRRQGLGDAISSAIAGSSSSAAEETTTTAESSTTTTTTTTQPATTTTSSAATTTTTSAAASTTTTTSAETTETTETTSDRTTTSAQPSETTVTSVITPTTVIVIGTSSITSTLPAITSTGVQTSSSGGSSSSASSGSQLSTGAKAGIAVGAAVGGLAVLALLLFVCLGVRRRKREKQNAADNILWPAVGDSSTLYPEQVHNTGGAGFGVGDDDDLDGPGGGGGGAEMSETGHGGSMLGAGAAGVGAAGLAGAGAARYGRQQQPTLPQVPPSVYSSEQTGPSYMPYSSSDGGNHLAPSIPSTFDSSPSPYSGNGYSAPGSQHSHAPLMAGAAGAGALVGAGGLAYNNSQSRHTPSPPRDYSTAGHSSEEGGAPTGTASGQGHLPFPGEPEQEFVGGSGGARPVSPTPMQVGDTFGQGYDESDNGKRWRLSVVNDDPRDRD